MRTSPLKILLVGPLAPPIGGATVLFELLIKEIKAKGVALEIVNTSRSRKYGMVNSLRVYFRILLGVIKNIDKSSVIGFHTSINGSAYFAPVLWIICKMWNKPLIIRLFGGNFDEFYLSLSRVMQFIVGKTVFKCNYLLLETRQLVGFFQNKINLKNVNWYPNSRKFSYDQNDAISSTAASKFIYIGAVRPEKGIREIIAAGIALNQKGRRPEIDVYGDCSDGVTPADFIDSPVKYRGAKKNDQIIETIKNYDILLLPTFYKGEGYPGAILEAFSVGIPVITTRWRAIPEIVGNGITGILVEPRDAVDLEHAMEKVMLEPDFYRSLRLGASLAGQKFSSEIWTEKFLDLCKDLYEQ